MLWLTRKPGERIMIDDHTVIQVGRIDRNHVRIGITAPGRYGRFGVAGWPGDLEMR